MKAALRIKSKTILLFLCVALPMLTGAALTLAWIFLGPPKSTLKGPEKTLKSAKVSTWSPAQMKDRSFAVNSGEITIAFAGDIMPWDKMEEPIRRNGVDFPYKATAPLFLASDLSVGNLECPVAEKAEKRTRARYIYKVPPKVLPGLARAGFDVFSLDNNHVLDCGEEGLFETMQNLEKAGFGYFGAGGNIDEAARAKIVELGGRRVAFVGFMSPETNLHDAKNMRNPFRLKVAQKGLLRKVGAKKDAPGAYVAKDEESVREVVRAARAAADYVVVFAHWGGRYDRAVFELQERYGHLAVDEGADLVVGCHGHSWQPVEIYKGKPIFYGMGNFAFGSFNKRADEAIVVRAVLRDGKTDRIEIYPLYTLVRKTQGQPRFMKGATAKNLLQRLSEWSAPRGAKIEIEDERGILRIPN